MNYMATPNQKGTAGAIFCKLLIQAVVRFYA